MKSSSLSHSAQSEGKTSVVTNVHLAHSDPESSKQLWNVICQQGRVHRISPAENGWEGSKEWLGDVIDGRGGVLLPSLCHSHIHLDKCFILDQCDQLASGSLKEALQVTNKAKAAFPLHLGDLYDRAARLIRESVEAGVTAMRAHVEVDATVEFECLNVGLRLAEEWATVCDIQIAVFAQEPLFSDAEATSPGPNYHLLVAAAARSGVSVVGSAPYFEPTTAQTLQNIRLIFDLAQLHSLHADFHLDYNLDPSTQPLIWTVIAEMRARGWTRAASSKCVTVGHATRLGLLREEEWHRLAIDMKELPLALVGLPQSDMYMMRGATTASRSLDVSRLWRIYGVHIAMSVNNVENAFTPQGSLDPLTLASLGVGMFQVGAEIDWMALLRAVTISSKEAIGIVFNINQQKDDRGDLDLVPQPGEYADFIIVHETRRWQSAILNPAFSRTTVRRGNVVATRKVDRWNANMGELEGTRV
ncbi:hypothetical protein SERLA73DRAFT_182935 [Serpula lacrymans var. lacrymans S7.3]|uniref:Amidohydrolase-related domain-containing protein n=2 Tax=Serpula lacrymans var. lacrymans TaxID=341189 RepID=F8Q197_SERL3|nr:uncharacterized protein SERLADRAFT_469826 [Serpula lacrymans var. lacrymans S7.9]EGN98075.1 hypothetical protein SERLA73DRAFT_182935 [Serpula lacrymans var. lacrymans S7.3]EGO23661.1 hypothetical protein SERLADRAFT_469826 [Serpula lacrymans var. lacrymans S7.9]